MIDYKIAIRKLRLILNVSQSELANLLSVSYVSVNRWENGHTKPTILVQEKLKDLFIKYGISEGQINER